MIVKTFFLAKIIHRISAKSLRGKKSLRENLADNGTFLRVAGNGRRVRCGRRTGARRAAGGSADM
jgi:hypothetical protein